jgi:hypothetical protein
MPRDHVTDDGSTPLQDHVAGDGSAPIPAQRAEGRAEPNPHPRARKTIEVRLPPGALSSWGNGEEAHMCVTPMERRQASSPSVAPCPTKPTSLAAPAPECVKEKPRRHPSTSPPPRTDARGITGPTPTLRPCLLTLSPVPQTAKPRVLPPCVPIRDVAAGTHSHSGGRTSGHFSRAGSPPHALLRDERNHFYDPAQLPTPVPIQGVFPHTLGLVHPQYIMRAPAAALADHTRSASPPAQCSPHLDVSGMAHTVRTRHHAPLNLMLCAPFVA